MPNWIRNKIMIGNNFLLNKVIDKYVVEYKDEKGNLFKMFDFNKLIKRPEELEIEFSSKSDESLKLYLTYISPHLDYFGIKEKKMDEDSFDRLLLKCKERMITFKDLILKDDEIKELLEKYKDQSLEDILDLGKKQINNLNKYNSINWYDWSINNWGSKWNSTNFMFLEDGKGFSFDTAWDPPFPIIIKFIKDNPNLTFVYLFADESIGSGVGYVLVKNGKISYKGSFEDYSVDAFKLAFDVWGCEDDYKYNEELKTYQFIERK